MLNNTFKSNYISVITGGREVNQDLLDLPFDHIFFTGSKTVGHEVLKRAEQHFTSVTLELGGKSPVIVDKSANIKLAAKRIIFGKLVNVGQTCVAPDYILVEESIKKELIEALKDEIKAQYGENTLNDINYGKIISQKHFDKAISLLENQNIIYGGKYDAETLKIEPTLIDEPDLNSLIMQNEIFAPILPILTYKNYEEAINIIKQNDTPLALYVFAKNKKVINLFLTKIKFGGGCVNDTIMHVTSPRLAFGGYRASGLGAYHGKRGFDTFSHYKSIVQKGDADIPLRYRPFSESKKKIIKKFLK